ncbi:PREDICTED: centlein-like, partial [Tauraco erythrolophus]|uniref:centlein-like n=1 Tax=Tauraco erythrolophus TaxID=121530 RepID=UPI00052352AC
KELQELQNLYRQNIEHTTQQAELIKQLQALNTDTQKVLKDQEDAHTAETTSYQKLYNELTLCFETVKTSEIQLQQSCASLQDQLLGKDQKICQLQEELQQAYDALNAVHRNSPNSEVQTFHASWLSVAYGTGFLEFDGKKLWGMGHRPVGCRRSNLLFPSSDILVLQQPSLSELECLITTQKSEIKLLQEKLKKANLHLAEHNLYATDILESSNIGTGRKHEPMGRTTKEQMSISQHVEEPAPGQMDILMETAAGGEESTLEQVLLTGTVAHGGLTLEQEYPEGLQPVKMSHAGAGRKCEEERVAERSCYGLTEPPVKRSRSLSPKSSFRESEELRKLKIAERKIENLEKTLQLKTRETDELRAAHEKHKERLQMLQTNYRALKEQLKQWEEGDSRIESSKSRCQHADMLCQEDSDAVWNELAFFKREHKKLLIEK